MLETERLILRHLTVNDFDAVFALRSDAEIMRFIRAPQNRAESVNWIEFVSSRWKDEKIGFCAVVEKSSNKFIGWCGLWRLAETDEIEIGYAIDKRFWNKGYAAEAAQRVLQYGFDELGFDKIVAVTRPENLSSRRVMEKLGMKFECVGNFYKQNLAYYSIAKKEFSDVRRQVEKDAQKSERF